MRFYPSSLIPHPFLTAVALLAVCLSMSAQPNFDFADWTSFKDTRGARAIDAGLEDIFFATDGGILSYNLFKNRWYDPMVMGYGLSEAVPIGDPVLLFMDTKTGKLWVANRSELLIFELGLERWKRISDKLWPLNERVVNFGAKGNQLYIETIPESIYSRFVANNRPLPNPLWEGYVTRYVGSRDFGNFHIDNSEEPLVDVQWRGLRSQVKLEDADLGPATLGRPPAGFPPLLPPAGWTWNFDGTLMDPDLRPNPITDWYIDNNNHWWSTHWGCGIARADLYTVRTELHSQGPAGNDIRAILVTGEDVWMGGANTADRLGFSRADRSLKTWSLVERIDDTRIRTTYLHELAEWNGDIWFATRDGLLSYDKEGRWANYVVQNNLWDNNVTALEAIDDLLWIGTANGLCVMHAETHQIDRIPYIDFRTWGVRDLEVLGDTVYALNDVGIYKAARASREFSFADLDPGLLASGLRDVSTYGGEYWLVSELGVMRYAPQTGDSKSWLAEVWLDQSTPNCVHAMRDFIWIGTDKGFYRLRKRDGQWQHYTMKDGLVDNRVLVIRDDGDDLLIGTADGLTRFYWNRPRAVR